MVRNPHLYKLYGYGLCKEKPTPKKKKNLWGSYLDLGTWNFCWVLVRIYLVGGFNPFEKYESNGIISPGRDKKKCLKPPASDV